MSISPEWASILTLKWISEDQHQGVQAVEVAVPAVSPWYDFTHI